MPTTLVIVESPAKCKKIESYLGPGYKCVASFGHIRQLSSLNNIDISNHFKPTFDVVNDNKKQTHIHFLKREIQMAEDVILATDDDREGEAIAWHICDLFNLPINTTKRIIFHEITENAIQTAMLHPRVVDMKKVYSQQARQILDLLVGFTVTPMLWKYISQTSENSLSAGRCQTPALRLIYDNQMELNSIPEQKVYNTIGYFTNKCIPFELNKQFEDETTMMDFLEQTANSEHIYTRSDIERIIKYPPEPLTTSRIQQMASNEMRISPKDTMKCCQTLYEAGYITYMRTDSKKYSDEFINTTKKYIVQTYNNEAYIHPDIHLLSNSFTTINTDTDTYINTCKEKSKSKKKKSESNEKQTLAQEAHEAIRPTNIFLQTISDDMSPREKKLYLLIWQTTMESCMSPAEYTCFKNYVSTYMDNTRYSYMSELPHFLGWKIIKYKKNVEQEKEYHFLQKVKSNHAIEYVKIASKCVLKQQKLHYTEAKVVQLLEERGIGRPSTFSTLIDKIQERQYVKKQNVDGKPILCKDFELDEDTITETSIIKEFGCEKNKLIIQPLGILVIEFLNKHFDSIFNYDYTKHMEEDLDSVCKDEKVWHDICEECLQEIKKHCDALANENKYEIKIDDTHFYMIGKHGPVIKCVEVDSTNTHKKQVSFLPVYDNIDLKKLERGEYLLQDLIAPKKMHEIELGQYKTQPLWLKKGKYGVYATWGEHSKSLACFGNRPLENITLEDVIEELDKHDENSNMKSCGIIRFISNEISIRQGKYGDYIFYKTSKMKKPLFLKLHNFKQDYKTCTNQCFMEWFSKEHIAM